MGAIKIKVTGLDKLEKQLNKLEKVASTKSVTFAELFTPAFMRENTDYPNLDDFFTACGINSSEDYDALPQETLEEFVRQHTKFSKWQDMIDVAAKEEMSRRINKALK